MAETVFFDFTGGMNALGGVDKLDPKECLLAENVRLDETGSILSAGAFTHQNTSSYNSSQLQRNVHSLYWNPSFGAVAGIGKDVFIGLALGTMSNTLMVANRQQQKMSFASAPDRVYFDVGSVGYWTDQTELLQVDWEPPNAVGATITGPTKVGTYSEGDSWTNPGGIVGTTGTATYTGVSPFASDELLALMSTNSFAVSTDAITGITVNFFGQQTAIPATGFTTAWQVTLLKDGIPTGEVQFARPTESPQIGVFQTYEAGGPSNTWGATLSPDDINSGTFGFEVQLFNGDSPGYTNSLFYAYDGEITIYQAKTGAGTVAGTGAGNGLTGTYTWKVAFVAANGEESEASEDTVPVVLTDQAGTLTAIPLGDDRTIARNIYRIGGSLSSHYLVGATIQSAYTIADNTSTTYSDTTPDIDVLAAGIILAGDIPGDYPNTRLGSTLVRFPAYHYDRTFWVNQDQPNQIIWSKPLNGFAYPVVNFINVGDSKPISRIVSIFGELIIIKTDSIWRLTGTDESSFNLVQTPSNVGTDMPFTVFAMPDKIIFANRWGLWVFNGYTSVPLTNKLDLWFKQLDRTNAQLFGVNGFHPPEIASLTVPANFEAVGNSEKYVLSYAEAGETLNNAILEFDLKHVNITKRTTGGNPLSLAIDPVTGYVYMGDSLGFISLIDDWNGATQGDNAANFDFQHGYQDVERGSNKAIYALEFFLNTNGQSLTPYIYFDNGEAAETLAALSATTLQRIVRRVTATQSRKMQNFSWRLNGSLSTVNSNGTPQIEIVHVKALYDVRTGRARTGQT